MAARTTNFNLVIMQATDKFSKEAINENTNIIDAALKTLTDNQQDVTTFQARLTQAEADIDQLQTSVNSFETQLAHNSDEVNALTPRVTQAETDIDALETRMTTAEEDIQNIETNFATKTELTTAITNTTTYVNNRFTDLIGGAPAALDTLKEIADELSSNDSAVASITNALANKVDKVAGKGLSTNDYTTAEKDKLALITATKAVNLDTLVSNISHTHANLNTLNKLGESSGKLTYNGIAIGSSDVAGGAKTWAVNTDYKLSTLVVYKGLLYRAMTEHTSTIEFDETKWELLDVGYIGVWAENELYVPGMVVTRGTNIYRCLVEHNSYAWDNTQRNYWEIIAGKGSTFMDWQPNTDYSAGEVIVYNNCIYRALYDHTSSNGFPADMMVGFEKWETVSTAGSAGAIKQATFLGAAAGSVKDIALQWTTNFLCPPVEILKFAAGAQDQVFTAASFSAAEKTKYNINGESAANSKFISFDGVVKPVTSYPLTFSAPATLGSGMIVTSGYIDGAEFKSVSSISIN